MTLKRILLVSCCALTIIAGLFWLGGQRAIALSNVGPDTFDFDGEPVFYTLSETVDVRHSGNMGVSVYYTGDTAPGSSITVDVTYQACDRNCNNLNNRSPKSTSQQNSQGYGDVSFTVGSRTYRDDPDSFTIPASAWSRQSPFKALISADLQGSPNYSNDADHINFRLRVRPGVGGAPLFIGPSANRRFGIVNPNYAVAYHDYNIDFAPACDQTPPNPPKNQEVTMYDMDNDGTHWFQPQPLKVYINDSTDGPNQYVNSNDTRDSEGSGATTNFKFDYKAQHDYQLQLKHVSAANVLQITLPFDSVNSKIKCSWLGTGTTRMYNSNRDTSTCNDPGSRLDNASADHFDAQGNYLLTINGRDDKHICFFNDVQVSGTETANFEYGIRYSTYYPRSAGGDDNWHAPTDKSDGSPPTTSPRVGRGGNDVKGGCSWPNQGNWTRPILFTNSAYGDNGGTAACNNPDNIRKSLEDGEKTDGDGYTWNWVNVPKDTPEGTKFCEWVLFDPDDGNSDGSSDARGHSQAVCFKVVVPTATATPACRDIPLNEDGESEEANEPFRLSVSVDNTSLYPGNLHIISITGPGMMSRSGSPSKQGSTYFSAKYQADAGGVYTVTYDIDGVPSAAQGGPCTAHISVGYKPYFTVSGGDAVVGCESPGADLKSWNNNDTVDHPDYTGAGTTRAALATGDILSFITSSTLARNNAAVNPVAGLSAGRASLPSVLAFANNNGVDDHGSYGGNFGRRSALPCSDPVGNAPEGDQAPGAVTVPDADAVLSYQTGDVLLSGNTLTQGHHVTMYVDGDVYIQTPITYSPTSISDIPSFALYTTGSIYVDSSIGTLYGTYAAGSGDAIFATCATAIRAETTKYSLCSNKLTIYGAVSGGHIHFDRSFGSLNAGQGASETIRYSPQVWLPTKGNGLVCAGGACKYDLITSLPPIL